MVVRLDDLSKQEDKPRFVSRKQRAQMQRDFAPRGPPESAPPESAPRSPKRAKDSSDPDAESSVDDSVDDSVELPPWRVAKESDAQQPRQPGTEPPRKWIDKLPGEMAERDWRIMRSDLQIACASMPDLHPLHSWSELPNKRLAESLAAGPYKQPTPIQRAAVPLALDGSDVVGIAQTGSGKTLGFTIPLLLSKAPRALVLAPTRELALQTAAVIVDLAELVGAKVVAVVGGRDFEQQHAELDAAVAAAGDASLVVIVATPGRLLDFTRQGLLDLRRSAFLVLDEADRMIDLGFEEQLGEIMALLPESHQTLMFTATWPRKIQELASAFSRPGHSHRVEVGAVRRSASVQQEAELLDAPHKKVVRLTDLVRQARPPIIVFVATKAAADELAPQLPSALPLHGSMSQEKREFTINALRKGTTKCIIATDVASRGLDIPAVDLVVNYDLPGDIDTYIHRIGRTGRAGRGGRAVSLCLSNDAPLFQDLRRVFRESGSPVPAFLI